MAISYLRLLFHSVKRPFSFCEIYFIYVVFFFEDYKSSVFIKKRKTKDYSLCIK